MGTFLTTVKLTCFNFLANTYLFLGDGDVTQAGTRTGNWAKKIIFGLGTAIALAGGAWLIVRGLLDVIKGLSAQNKDLKAISTALGVLTAGGLIMVAGIAFWVTVGKNIGADFQVNP